MNLPNKLTIARIAMIPIFLFFLMTDFAGENSKYIAAFIFIIASLTDLLDGNIARKNNIVTNFGKFMDPLADKLLVSSALIAFIQLDYLPAWIVIIIISRDFIISGFRLVASDNGIVIAASKWAKIKTTVQMLMVILLIFKFDFPYVNIVENVFIYSALILTVVSLLEYLIKNKNVMIEGGNK